MIMPEPLALSSFFDTLSNLTSTQSHYSRRQHRAPRRARPASPKTGPRSPASRSPAHAARSGRHPAARRAAGHLAGRLRGQRVPRAVVRPGPVAGGRPVRAGGHRLHGLRPDRLGKPAMGPTTRTPAGLHHSGTG